MGYIVSESARTASPLVGLVSAVPLVVGLVIGFSSFGENPAFGFRHYNLITE